MLKLPLRTYWILFCLLTCAVSAQAELLTEKQRFHLDEFSTFNGQIIKNLNVGWESYGTLSEDKDNVILITHYFTGNSHAAGKYQSDDEKPGYWDSIIGPGKAIDTNQYFVISVDTLVNASAHDPKVITTGPASLNPDTGKPWGLDFPVVTIRDFVNVQKALMESLGISRLHAVVGPSMGSFQAIDWASAYPDWVPRMISVIGAAESDAWTTAALEHWATPIKLDPAWNKGQYPKNHPPIDGLTHSLMLITQQALHPAFFNQVLAHQPLDKGPLNDIRQSHQIVQWLKKRAASRASIMDANHILYLVRACQLFVAGHSNNLEKSLSQIKAKTLFLPASRDQLLLPYMAEKAHTLLRKQHKNSQLTPLTGQLGHLDGLFNIAPHHQLIADFLADKDPK